MKVSAALANGVWLTASLPAWQRFRRGLRNPEEAQTRILHRVLKDNASSAFGRAHGFEEIRSYEQFCQRVPVTGYQGLEPWIHRIMRGEKEVLTCEPVTRLLPTSGTTGGRKYIPFTCGLQRQFNQAIAAWTVDLSRTYPGVPFGPAYWSISPAQPASVDEKSVVPTGFDSDSAYLGGALQRIVEMTFAAPTALRLVDDLDCFRYLTLLSLLRQPDLRFVSVWHPSFLTSLLDALSTWWDELISDVERGGCQRAITQSPEVRRSVQAPPQRNRARWLTQAGTDHPQLLWPRWRVISCWGDGHAAMSVENLRARWPHLSVQKKGLLATEAFVSIPFRSRHPLAVTSHFYEFADADGDVHPAHVLKLGQQYEVIVTTAGGLWRYRLGDLVEVDDFIGATPSLKFIGRGGGVSDLCGEKLTETFVARAMQDAFGELTRRLAFAMLAPEISDAGQLGYTLFVEGENHDYLAARLDQELRRNPHYAYCRDLGQLDSPRCLKISKAAYQTYCRVLVSEGRRLGEIKPLALSPRTDWKRHFEGTITPAEQE